MSIPSTLAGKKASLHVTNNYGRYNDIELVIPTHKLSKKVYLTVAEHWLLNGEIMYVPKDTIKK